MKPLHYTVHLHLHLGIFSDFIVEPVTVSNVAYAAVYFVTASVGSAARQLPGFIFCNLGGGAFARPRAEIAKM